MDDVLINKAALIEYRIERIRDECTDLEPLAPFMAIYTP